MLYLLNDPDRSELKNLILTEQFIFIAQKILLLPKFLSLGGNYPLPPPHTAMYRNVTESSPVERLIFVRINKQMAHIFDMSVNYFL